MTHKPQWVIFDVGGVLLDWHSSSQATAEYLNVGHSELFDALFDQTIKENIGSKMTVGKMSAQEGWVEVIDKLQRTSDIDSIIQKWHGKEYWFEDTLRLIADLHTAGYKLAILSNSWLGMDKPENHIYLPSEIRLFDMIFDSSSEGMAKPHESIYQLVEERIGSSGKDIFFIDDDDSGKNIATADSRQWQTFLYSAGAANDGIASNEKLRELLLS